MSSITMLPCPFCGSDQRLSVFTDATGHRSKVIADVAWREPRLLSPLAT